MFTRIIASAAVAVCLVALVSGCQQKDDVSPNVAIGDPTAASGGDNTAPTQADLAKMGSEYGTTDHPVTATPPTPPTPTPTATTPPTGARIHKMAPGETIFRLGEKYYGRATKANEQKILDANRAKYPDPRKIPVGAEIIIPE